MARTILLGVTGGIAVYKSVSLVSLLKKRGYDVVVVMTRGAERFVTPLLFQTMSRERVYSDPFEEADPSGIAHIDVADRADLVVVAPATANVIAKLAHGIADDMLSTVLLAATAPVMIAPAMNVHMYRHPAVQANLALLTARGYHFLEPDEGPLACGYTGKGRMMEPEAIVEAIEDYFSGRLVLASPNPDPLLAVRRREKAGERVPMADVDVPSPAPGAGVPSLQAVHDAPLSGRRVVVTAGPTREAIDPVRFLSNRSSGKMGYALAAAARRLGAEVVLITGPTNLPPPEGVKVVRVERAREMHAAVMRERETFDWFIAAAAVSDYEPAVVEAQKIKKSGEALTLMLVPTPDILRDVGQRKKPHQTVVGFAAETNDVVEHARNKRRRKGADWIVANDVTEPGAGFEVETNRVVLVGPNDALYPLPLMSKEDLAETIIRTILAFQSMPPAEDAGGEKTSGERSIDEERAGKGRTGGDAR
ncbi:MAG: bifunctional phosphopantothenoylcysteine decarboxylase/phosphopantothenate--cysteine ligase CoaBC [Hydrogenibacillus sp.]|nr:bifunctional phosphopantothenoylcysteine decarboxylase/phosphopantothenate--cysteine ligase CoaBC [Hydrogenibacillus sp.]